jgi:hypothetical protein
MESVSADAFPIQRVRDREPIRDGGVASVEGGVEAGDMRDSGEPFAQTFQHVQRRGIVQWGERRNRLDLGQDRVIDQDGAVQVGAAMYDAVAECRDVSGQRAIGQIGQSLHRRVWIGGGYRAVMRRLADPPIPSTWPDINGGASGVSKYAANFRLEEPVFNTTMRRSASNIIHPLAFPADNVHAATRP